MAKYYQPQRREDFTIPREMYSWQVFRSKDDAIKWLVGFGYDLSDFDIIEYEGNHILPEQKAAEWNEKHIADIFEKVGLAKIAREQKNDELTNALQDAMLELSKLI